MRKIILLVCIVLVFLSCEEKITDPFAYSGILGVSETEIRFETGAYSKTLKIEGVIDWDIDTNSMENWCKIMPVKDFKGAEYATVKVDSNTLTDNRETEFIVFSGEQQIGVKVFQLGNTPQILFSIDSLVIGLDTNLLKIDFIANTEYEISYNGDWFTAETVDHEGNKRLLIYVSANHTGEDRNAVLSFKNKNGDEEWEWGFRQLSTRAPFTPIGVDKLNPNMKVLPISATASSEAEGKGIEKSYDGNKSNYYQSKYQNETEPVALEYSFDGTTPIDYINYIPYEGDTEKSFKDTEIWVKEEGGEYELIKTYLFYQSGQQVVVFDNTIEKPQSIKFVVKSSYDTEKDLMVVACSEMEFYSAEMRYTDIFADPIYGSLKNDVTLDKIFDMEDEVFRNIAYHLYHNTYDEGRILNCSSFLDENMDIFSFYGSYGGLDNVTGVVVKKGEEVPIFADRIKQDVVYAVVFNPENPNERRRYRLFDGVNKITMDYDGHLYINYVSPEAKEIDVHIAGGRYNGYFDLSKQTVYNLSSTTPSSYVDVVGEHAHLIFRKEDVQDSDLTSLVTAYDKIVRSQQVFMGLEKYQEEFDNRVLFLVVNDYLEVTYTGGYVACPEIDMVKFSTAENITGKTLWDLAVAVGIIHNHTGLSWSGVSYTTPKLFALATQEAFEETLEINKNGGWYLPGFSSIIVPEKKLTDFPDNLYDYPEKIVPFWQLYYYAQILGKDDFYKDLLKKCRERPIPIDRFFVQFAQQVLELDLTEFVRKWGFRYTYYNNYPAPPKTLAYLTPKNMDHFRHGNTIPSANGYKISRGKVTVYNPQNVVVYFIKHTYVPMQIFDINSFYVSDWKDSMRVYAVGIDGTEVELNRL